MSQALEAKLGYRPNEPLCYKRFVFALESAGHFRFLGFQEPAKLEFGFVEGLE